jgi:hypothetical protein
MGSQAHAESYDIYFLTRCLGILQFEGGVITPVEDIQILVDEFTQSVHEDDGFLYPPITRRWRIKKEFTEKGLWETDREPVRGSRRQALLFTLPITHTILIEDRIRQRDYGHGDEAFLLHALAYLFGTRLQFSKWFVDMRLPVTKDTRDFFLKYNSASTFLSLAYATWRGWPAEAQGRVVNALYMNSRSPSYEWDWERFAVDYMVFDALYRTAHEVYGVDCQSHRDRLTKMCERFGVPVEQNWLTAIYQLRNELFHESLWDGHQPGLATSEDAFRAVQNLRYLNMRLIAGVLGYAGDYLHTEWWRLGTAAF